MKLAYFSPMPPSSSGIADYSAALVPELERLCRVDVFTEDRAGTRRDDYDLRLYQIGNNSWHAHAYRQALADPGVVVLHEANLHHLIAEMTIRPGDWDAYLREVAFDGGSQALEFAQRVRKLEVGPDYEGVPMLRRLLASAKALIVHSNYVLEAARQAGFAGPAARIPHGAWVDPVVPTADRLSYRRRLGLDEDTPLVGIFGHLKPYKRIPESLRAFRRLLRLDPRVKLILVGEPHPDLALEHTIHSLGLGAAVRVLGRTSIEDFTGYLAACDVVLNLRYPTVGETSGTLLRSFSLGRPVLVSDVGAFAEFPPEVCLRVPVGAGEEDILFEYLHLLVTRPDLARALGERGRGWVERECSWPHVARLYHSFLTAVAEGQEWEPPKAPPPPEVSPPVEPDYIRGWAVDEGAKGYVETHLTRLSRTLELVPPGTSEDRILEMGAYLQITPALRTKLGYGEVRGCYYGPAGKRDPKSVTSAEGEQFDCVIDLFDAEKDPFPYPDEHFSCVLCCELIEHLPADPMHMMAEINRVLRPGGCLILTTPNIGSLRAIHAILQGYHPGFFPAYLKPPEEGEQTDARHNREYTPKEIYLLFNNAGFSVSRLETGEFLDHPQPELLWVADLLERYHLEKDLRGDGIYAVGVKDGPVRERYPAWLYS